ncbi:MAG: hypothetical protein EOO41_03375, partial [Methanobacteriota archaeon]
MTVRALLRAWALAGRAWRDAPLATWNTASPWSPARGVADVVCSACSMLFACVPYLSNSLAAADDAVAVLNQVITTLEHAETTDKSASDADAVAVRIVALAQGWLPAAWLPARLFDALQQLVAVWLRRQVATNGQALGALGWQHVTELHALYVSRVEQSLARLTGACIALGSSQRRAASRSSTSTAHMVNDSQDLEDILLSPNAAVCNSPAAMSALAFLLPLEANVHPALLHAAALGYAHVHVRGDGAVMLAWKAYIDAAALRAVVLMGHAEQVQALLVGAETAGALYMSEWSARIEQETAARLGWCVRALLACACEAAAECSSIAELHEFMSPLPAATVFTLFSCVGCLLRWLQQPVPTFAQHMLATAAATSVSTGAQPLVASLAQLFALMDSIAALTAHLGEAPATPLLPPTSDTDAHSLMPAEAATTLPWASLGAALVT